MRPDKKSATKHKMKRKYSSSLGAMKAHVSYKVKYCHRIFRFPRIKARCEQIFMEVSHEYGFAIEELGFDEDHVHFVVDIGVRFSVCQITKLLKGTSGKKLLQEFPLLKQIYFWGSGLWSPTIYFDSVGEKTEESALHYVRTQGLPREVKINPGQQSLSNYATMPPVCDRR